MDGGQCQVGEVARWDLRVVGAAHIQAAAAFLKVLRVLVTVILQEEAAGRDLPSGLVIPTLPVSSNPPIRSFPGNLTHSQLSEGRP